ncbi:hypothetical protein BGW36DRAFT_423492 [Talaromyces proteolyticus]|uniref:VOC domain-containing protein n=1 Tax=Talaromyces proteolyticus TaxID=1131652 RepID=A0AAD4Q5F4_9EURO|nr:uncharacterized protein BGW36DRAFT_423492 [Talaromyces proteolyticus]KAH8703955.1 hypothetical protein BGW36DRAFT_423492 [Talaromyces proteolyticus]
MPLSHLTLTVSHLPTSTSFFLACLQPLGYQYIGRHDEFIGFGSKADEPADFWLSQERPGTPAGAVHIAFPAPSKEAVNAFFVNALKAGGKIHGEPKTRDHESGYFSAAIIDFDGNSIEAVYRPDVTTRSQTGGPTFQKVKNDTVVSRARSTKTETVVRAKTVYAINDIPPSQVRSLHDQHLQQSYPLPSQGENSNITAKTIIGTLLGATAGAAIAYAMVKGDSSSSQPPAPPSGPSPPSQYAQQQQPIQQMPLQLPMSMPIIPMLGPAPSAPALQEPPTYRALEAPPPARSTYTANDAISAFTRSATSKSPRADTIYEDTEYYPPVDGPRGSVYSQETSGIRRSSNGSVYATRDIPIRAIDYPGSQKGRSQSYPCDPSTLISSYAENSRAQLQGHIIGDAETEFSSISTIKPAKSMHSSSSSSAHRNKSSHHHSHTSSHSPPQQSQSILSQSPSSHRSSKSHASKHSHNHRHLHPDETYSSTSSSRSAHKTPLPDSKPTSVASYSHRSSTSKRSKSHTSPHAIPLPASTAPSTIFLDAVDIDVANTALTPDDSISQVGINPSPSDHKQSRSKPSSSSSSTSKRSSNTKKFDEPVRPSDSISQVSSNHSRTTERTVKAYSKSGSRGSHY